MSWLSSRGAQNAANYRSITFEGARILQAKELNDLQTAQGSRDKYDLTALYKEGALLNAVISVSGLNVTLANENTSFPILACFNGGLEPVANQVVSFATVKASGTDTLYLHWVLWRVTADGTYPPPGGTAGCLTDAGLVDTATGEPVGERGQLQLILTFTTDLSVEAIDTVRMISKSTTAVPLCQFIWTSSVAALVAPDGIQSFAIANATRSGMVKLSTGTASGVAASTDDSRMSDQRIPTDASVKTAKVSVPEADTGTTDIGTAKVKVGSGNLGIDSARSFFSGLAATVHDTLAWLYDQMLTAASELLDHEGRIVALEHKAAPVVDLSFHIGQPLGRVSDGSFAHQPLVEDDVAGYEHVSGMETVGAGEIQTSPYWAFVTKNKDRIPQGGIRMDGDYQITNPGMVAAIAAANGGAPINGLYELALLVALINKGQVHP